MRATLLVGLAALFTGANLLSASPARASAADDAATPRVAAAMAAARPAPTSATIKPPIVFEPNRGQADAPVRFVARNAGADLFLTDAGAVLALQEAPQRNAGGRAQRSGLTAWTPQWLASIALAGDTDADQTATRAVALRYAFEHARPHPPIEPLDPLPGRSNYFIGNDPRRWRTDIPQYARVRYRDVLPGVNVVYYGNSTGQIEFDVEVEPGADLAQVRLRVDGADGLAIDDDGDLHIRTALGEAIQRKPLVYQIVDGQRRELRGGYVLVDGDDGVAREIAFAVPDYDRSLALVLDPTLAGSFLISDSGSDIGYAVAADSSGNWYLTGVTGSLTFPTTVGAYQTTKAGGNDVFVYKVSNDGGTVAYATYIGGSSSDIGFGIGVDAAGIAYVTGTTGSSNFPVLNALLSTYPGHTSAFVTALNASGNALVYSTYLGGSDLTLGQNAIAADAAGDAFVTGTTYAQDLPISPGAFQSTGPAFGTRMYAFKFLPDGTRAFGTYIVDDFSGGEQASSIAIDALGNSYIAGYTNWNYGTITFNGVVAGAIGPIGGTTDAIVARLNATGTRLDWITLVGGSATDEATAVAINASHQVLVAAWSASGDLPPATGQTSNDWVWIGRLDETGTQLLDARWLGAAGANAFPLSLALDEARRVVAVAGYVDNPASLPALNPLANDCGPTCTGSSGGLFATFVFDANGLMQPESVTRIVGVNGAGNNRINGLAIYRDWGGAGVPATPFAAPLTSVPGKIFANGVSDGTPPPLMPMFTGNHVYTFQVSGAGNPPPVLPPIVAKNFSPTQIAAGNGVVMNIVIINPNPTTDITHFTVSDSFPACIKPLFARKVDVVFTPGSCKNLLDPAIDASFPNGDIEIPRLATGTITLPAGTKCTITLPFQVQATENCVNTTNVATSDQGNAPAASARLLPLTLALGTWSGGGGNASMGVGMNWTGGVAPGNGDNVVFPPGVMQLAVNNDLPASQDLNAINLTGTGYNLGGGTFHLFGGIFNSGASNTASAAIRADAPLIFSSSPAGSTLNFGGGIDLNGNGAFFLGAGNINITSALAGSGDVVLLGPGHVTLTAAPTFAGSFFAAGGALITNNLGISESIDVTDGGTVQGTGPFGALHVDGGTARGFTSAPQVVSISSLTVDTGTVELTFSANNGTHTTLALSGAGQLNGGTLKVDFGTAPTIGAVFGNLITAPGSITGCFSAATATPANVFVVPQCTANAVGVAVVATDGVFRNGFE